MKEGFMTPPDHENFEAKKLFGAAGEIMDGSIAYMHLNGGGPVTPHTHAHNHLFIVTKGEAEITLGEETILLKENESFLVEGKIPHAVWNHASEDTVMIGISVKGSPAVE